MADDLHAALRQMRLDTGLSGVEFAARLEMTPSAVYMIEKGERTPHLATLKAWVKACGRELRITFETPNAPPPALSPSEESLIATLRQLAEQTGGDPVPALAAALSRADGENPALKAAVAWAFLCAGGTAPEPAPKPRRKPKGD